MSGDHKKNPDLKCVVDVEGHNIGKGERLVDSERENACESIEL
jgi:hypothetical protein